MVKPERFISRLLLVVLWVILLAEQKEACYFSMNILIGKIYYIYNPGYPNHYEPDGSCDWNLKTAPGTKIYLFCEDIDIPSSPNCSKDRLLISQTGDRNYADSRNYCGKDQLSLLSLGDAMTIGLRIDQQYSTGGRFLCTVKAVKDNSTRSYGGTEISKCDCGWKQMTRITGGQESSVNEFAFMAALIYKKEMWCGANIISERFVLTAAHCVLKHAASDLLLLVGDHDVTTGSDTNSSAIYRIGAYEIHPQYVEKSQINDISILQTSSAIEFSMTVGPVCLPFRYTSYDFAKEDVTILGWGSLEFTGAKSDTLQKADVSTLTNRECSIKEEKSVSDGQICTYSKEGRDSCQLDSGGPVVWTDKLTNRYQVIGIISYGIGCGSASASINTRVTKYLQWIIDRTGSSFCVK